MRGSVEPNRPGDRTPVVALVVLACVAGLLVACSNQGDGGDAIRLEPAASAGESPFTESVQVTPVAEFPTDVVAVGADVIDDAAPDGSGEPIAIEGTTAGLYGGSLQRTVCNPSQLVGFLEANPEKAAAWASVFDVRPADIPTFVGGLTPTLLLADTRITNHGFRDGRATSFQAVLEAGTAVLVDDRGVPRVKCNCGNPLAPPRAADDAGFDGDPWTHFDPQRLVEVRPGQPVDTLEVVDLETGDRTSLPVGSSSGGDGFVVAQQDPDGLDSAILTSSDGAAWREVATIAGVRVEGLTHGPRGWVAVGRSAETSNPLAGSVVLTSADLRTWSEVAELDGLVYDVAAGNGHLVAVGDSPGGFVSEAGLVFSTPMVHVSSDGTNWTTDDDPLGPAGTAIGNRQPLGAVEYVDGVGFVLGAVHADDASDSDPFYLELFTSANGERWTAVGFDQNGAGSAMSAGGEPGVATEAALAFGDGILVQAAQPWVPPVNPDGMGDAPRVEEAIVVYDPPSQVESVPCGLCNPDGKAIDGTPFAARPASEMAFGAGAFLAVANDGDTAGVFRSSDARTWQEVGALDGPAGALAYGPLGAASGGAPSETPTTLAPTTTVSSAPPTTRPPSTVPPTTATTTIPPSGTAQGDAPDYSETGVSGSGCNPGGDRLPDGWWYGFAKTPIRAGSSFDFDLACYYYGRIAAQVAHEENPLEYPDETFIDDDVYVSNANLTTRQVPVATSADLRCLDMGTPGFGDQQPCSGPGVSWSVWVRVEGGSVTKVLEQFHP